MSLDASLAAAEVGWLWQEPVGACGHVRRISGHLAPDAREGWAEGRRFERSVPGAQEGDRSKGGSIPWYLRLIKCPVGQEETASVVKVGMLWKQRRTWKTSSSPFQHWVKT